MSAGSWVESTLAGLRDALRIVAPDAHLVEPRILRRVIRLDRRLAGLGIAIPHDHCYTIETSRLLAYVEWDELELPPTTDLPWKVILLKQPELERTADQVPYDQWLRRYSRLLFHGRLHMELERRLPPGEATYQRVANRREQIGELEFSEISSVLLRENQLFPETDDRETYIEFAASYWEMYYCAPMDRDWRFPSIRHWKRVEELLSQDVGYAQLWGASQLTHSIERIPVIPQAEESAPQVVSPVRRSGLRARSKQQVARAVRAVARGNGIRAAILRARLAEAADSAAEAQAAAAELQAVVRRLQPSLGLADDEVPVWTEIFQPLLRPASQGFWTVEARLLYDLQKVCVEHERGVFQVNLLNWCRRLGQAPLRVPLPLLREVLITKHLRSALRRVSATHTTADQQAAMMNTLNHASRQVEHRARDRIRPLIHQVLDQSGLVPQNVPEQVARLNVVEELLDHVVEQGAANLGNLRDSLSKNDIKLPDLSGAQELLQGDLLLRIDRQLGRDLGGIYRPGAVYLRSTQRLSSIAFGTATGRWLTKFLGIPFGGAYVVLEGLRHTVGLLTGASGHPAVVGDHGTLPVDTPSRLSPPYLTAIFLLGTWILLLLHSPQFRAWWWDAMTSLWRMARVAFVELPSVIFRSPFVRNILQSPAYAAARSYLLVPGLLTLLGMGAMRSWRGTQSWHVWFDVFLLTALFLNSRIGRHAEEFVADSCLRLWHDLRIRVFTAIYDWVMDTFHRLFVGLERIVYSVDEFLRFRAGDSRFVGGVKLLAGTVWIFIAYVVVFAFTLLIEPQINPIKHFPVVTVSHKLLIPIGAEVVKVMAPYVGTGRAHTIVWSTIWLIPGVFGFLVWELKENWRLYAANRKRVLTPVPVGHHGETMLHFLRTGFHSGTLPRLYQRLRKALARSHQSGDWTLFQRRESELHRIREQVHRFIDRRLLWLWKESQRVPGQYHICDSHLATNQIEVAIEDSTHPGSPLRLRWEELDGQLHGVVDGDSWVDQHTMEQRQAIATSLAGIFRLGAVDRTELRWPAPSNDVIIWQDWVRYWSRESKSLPDTSTNGAVVRGAVPSVEAADR